MAEITVYYEGPIVTRAEAKAAGLKRYFTGKPCKHGHIADRLTVDGSCRTCANAKAKRQYKTKSADPANRQRWRDKERARRADPKFDREHDRAIHIDWLRRNPERRKAAQARHRKKHGIAISLFHAALYRRDRDLILKRSATYRRTEKGKIVFRLASHRRRARKRGSPGTFSATDEAKLRERQTRCHICGRRFTKVNPATLDHVIALADGGPHDASNIALAHRSCNARKHAHRTHLI